MSSNVEKRMTLSEIGGIIVPDMEAYDGFLYPSTTIKEGDVKQRLLERIIESKKPCVSLEEEIPGLSFVGINQSKAMRQIVRHLAGVHGIHPAKHCRGMWGGNLSDPGIFRGQYRCDSCSVGQRV